MAKDDATWLNICYVLALVISSYVFYLAIDTIGLEFGWSERFEWFSMVQHAAAIALGIGFVLILRLDPERHEYFLNSIGELRKVSWPTWEDTKKMTVVVVVVVSIFGGILAVFDLVWAWTLKLMV